jgi:hypothetical protein
MARIEELIEIQKSLRPALIPAAELRNKSAPPAGQSLSAEAVRLLLDRGKAIYGVDGRAEPSSEVPLAPGVSAPVACLVLGDNLKPKAGGFRFHAEAFGPKYSLCKGERFHDQPCLGFGTGFLVAPDVLATAGHCVKGFNHDDVHIVFGFELDGNGLRDERRTDEVYNIKSAEFEVDPVSGADWAIVTLDRPVSGIAPLPVRTTPVAVGEDIYLIGHPVGLPKKVARGATVTAPGNDSYFVTNLDTFGGNSGSPVFDSAHKVCGILVRGAQDFVWQGNCRVAATFPLLQGGEDVCRATVWAERYTKDKLRSLSEPRTVPHKARDETLVRRELHRFFLQAFNVPDLKRLMTFNELFSDIRTTLPYEKGQSDIVDELVDALLKHDLVNEELFAILSRERPRRMDEILKIKSLAG